MPRVEARLLASEASTAALPALYCSRREDSSVMKGKPDLGSTEKAVPQRDRGQALTGAGVVCGTKAGIGGLPADSVSTS